MNKKFMLLGIALLSTFALQADEQEVAATEQTEQTADQIAAAEKARLAAEKAKKDADCGCKH